MSELTIRDIMRSGRVLTPWDDVGNASELLRSAPSAALPVVMNGRVLGIVSEEELSPFLSNGNGSPPSYDKMRSVLIDEVMREPGVSLVEDMSPQEAAEVFSHTDSPVLPVVDRSDFYVGLLSRLDLLSYQCRSLRPAMIGGMATPLGVYLTTGTFGIGAPGLGLFLTGATLMLLNCLGLLMTQGVRWLLDHTPFPMIALPDSPWAQLIDLLLGILPIALFLILIRLSPLAGFHAAEHQVVHAIENGEPLTPEVVSRMPRVHPRCGTNFMAGMMVMMLVVTLIEPAGIPVQMSVVIAALVTMATWRTVGELLQYYVTTRPASPRQLESGLRTGRALLERYQSRPGRKLSFKGRIWYSGILQVALGFFVTYTLMILAFGPRILETVLGPGF